MDIHYGRGDLIANPSWTEKNDNITYKYNTARKMALDGGYDALFTVEADMILPPLALERMTRIEADVVYGLYVSRHGKHPWLAFSRVTPEIRGSKSFDEYPDLMQAAWGRAVETVGVGMGCTLIWRHVLEAIPFRNTDELIANDWYFSLDLQAGGYMQKHDCGVVCGHIEGDRVYWPDPLKGYVEYGLL